MKDLVIKTVKLYGEALRFAPDELRNDVDVVMEAVKNNHNSDIFTALECASDTLKNIEKVVLLTVEQNGFALKYASDILQNGREIVLAAVKKRDLLFVLLLIIFEMIEKLF